MKKFSFFSVMVALTFMFGACNKDAPNQIADDGAGVSGVKKFMWVDNGNPAAGYYYNYGKVTASDFAHFESGGTQFNNGCEFEVPGTDGSILLCREPGNNGNGWVKIKFLPEAIKFVEKDMDCDYAIGVRFKGSLNAVYTFNIGNCITFGDWIELDVAEMGPITQIRFGGAASFYCNPKPETVTIRFYRSKWVNCKRVYDEEPFYTMEFPKGGEFSGCLVWEAGANVDPDFGLPYHSPIFKTSVEVGCNFDNAELNHKERMAEFYGWLGFPEPKHKWVATNMDDMEFIDGHLAGGPGFTVVEENFRINEDLDLLCLWENHDPTCDDPCIGMDCGDDFVCVGGKCVRTHYNIEFYQGTQRLCGDKYEVGTPPDETCARDAWNQPDCSDFDGWFDDPGENGDIVDIENLDEDITVYAKFTVKLPKINWVERFASKKARPECITDASWLEYIQAWDAFFVEDDVPVYPANECEEDEKAAAWDELDNWNKFDPEKYSNEQKELWKDGRSDAMTSYLNIPTCLVKTPKLIAAYQYLNVLTKPGVCDTEAWAKLLDKVNFIISFDVSTLLPGDANADLMDEVNIVFDIFDGLNPGDYSLCQTAWEKYYEAIQEFKILYGDRGIDIDACTKENLVRLQLKIISEKYDALFQSKAVEGKDGLGKGETKRDPSDGVNKKYFIITFNEATCNGTLTGNTVTVEFYTLASNSKLGDYNVTAKEIGSGDPYKIIVNLSGTNNVYKYVGAGSW